MSYPRFYNSTIAFFLPSFISALKLVNEADINSFLRLKRGIFLLLIFCAVGVIVMCCYAGNLNGKLKKEKRVKNIRGVLVIMVLMFLFAPSAFSLDSAGEDVVQMDMISAPQETVPEEEGVRDDAIEEAIEEASDEAVTDDLEGEEIPEEERTKAQKVSETISDIPEKTGNVVLQPLNRVGSWVEDKSGNRFEVKWNPINENDPSLSPEHRGLRKDPAGGIR